MSRIRTLQLYIITRLLLAPIMVWFVTTLVFLLLRATPGDPVDSILGPRAPALVKQALREQLGLTGSIWHQYRSYMGQLLNLDLGSSLVRQGQTVWGVIQDFFPATVELALLGMTIALVVGITMGCISATHPNSLWDGGGRLFGIITYALPAFWIGMLAQLIFGVWLQWFPLGTRFPITQTPPQGPTGLYVLDSLLAGNWMQTITSLHYLALPSLTLGVLISGIFERIVRVNLKKTLQSDYVEAARARGIPEWRILMFHALQTALIPVVTVMGLTLAALLGGAILTEVTFSWPGLGNRLYDAISLRDYPTVQGIIIFFAGIVSLASIAVDIFNAVIDPRIRY